MKPDATVAVTAAGGRWAGPALLSVAVHLCLAAGYFVIDGAYTPPKPPPIFPIEVVLETDVPGMVKPRPPEPAKALASAPAAPAKSAPEPEESATPATPPKSVPAPEKPLHAMSPANSPPATAKAATHEPAGPPMPEGAKPAPRPAPAQLLPADYAPPLPKRKPVLSPPPISATAKRAPPRSAGKTKPPTPAKKAADSTSPLPAAQPVTHRAEPSPVSSQDDTPSVASAGDATATLVPPRYAAPGRGNPLPVYPRAAKRRGIEGRLVLRIEVTSDGRAGTIRVLESSGHRLLDHAAENAVRRWTFEPARRAGIPVAAVLDVPVVFRLRD